MVVMAMEKGVLVGSSIQCSRLGVKVIKAMAIKVVFSVSGFLIKVFG